MTLTASQVFARMMTEAVLDGFSCLSLEVEGSPSLPLREVRLVRATASEGDWLWVFPRAQGKEPQQVTPEILLHAVQSRRKPMSVYEPVTWVVEYDNDFPDEALRGKAIFAHVHS